MFARRFLAATDGVAGCFPGLAAAQDQRGSIEGVVKDASGAVLPGALLKPSPPSAPCCIHDHRCIRRVTGSRRSRPDVPGERQPQGFVAAGSRRGPRRPRPDQEGRLRAAARGRRRDGDGHRRDPARRRAPERAADQHPRRAGRTAAARPRLHDHGDAGAGREPGSEAGRHLDRRRQRRREPLHHRRHRDDQPADRPLGHEPDRRLRRRSPGQVERLLGRIRRRHSAASSARSPRAAPTTSTAWRSSTSRAARRKADRRPDAAPEPDQLRRSPNTSRITTTTKPATSRASRIGGPIATIACGSSAPTSRR